MSSIVTIEGVGEVNAKKLKKFGINTVEKLLNMGATPKGRKEIAEKTGIGEKVILQWVNFADLFRVKGYSINLLVCCKFTICYSCFTE